MSGSVSRTSSTRRNPATAFCASLSTSLAVCTGATNSVTRNRKAISVPAEISPAEPEQDADDDDRGVGHGGDELAGDEDRGGHLLGVDRRAVVPVDGGVDAGRRPGADAVGAHRRRADDGLGDRAEHVADPLADDAVGGSPAASRTHRTATASGMKQTSTSRVSCQE